MSPKVSVIITTRDRADMLGYALASVRRQTWLGAVGQVIVSENGLSDKSREVCAQFQDLPILYVKQEPPVTSLMHLNAIWPHIKHSYVAILHDDDWWMPEHLEDALGTLESHPECAGTFSNFLDSWGPKVVPAQSVKAWRVWVSSECDFSQPVLMLDKASVLLACMIESSFHYSTVVARKDAYWGAYLKVVEAENAWDNERTFPVFLSAFGSIGYLTKATAVIRNHPTQEGFEPAFREKGFSNMRVNTTRRLGQLDPETTALAVKRFNNNAKALRSEYPPRPDYFVPDYVNIVSNQIDEPQKTALIKEFGFNLVPGVAAIKKKKRRDAKWVVKQLLPPAVIAVPRKMKRAILGGSDED